jgi:hypothetical protein
MAVAACLHMCVTVTVHDAVITVIVTMTDWQLGTRESPHD